jgi:hypothetical protein
MTNLKNDELKTQNKRAEEMLKQLREENIELSQAAYTHQELNEHLKTEKSLLQQNLTELQDKYTSTLEESNHLSGENKKF